uniref:sce7726 family protein n=1 Tax=Ningiella ruwaisensis TaxID=2364274 RepID=UPI00109F2CC7|nr:sce7726 family protein [Ningiella ruwaisensis]
MTDPEIRQLLFSRLAKRKTFDDSQICEEIPIQNGLVRADVVLCGNKLECFEIKSHKDTLKRLFAQGWHYGQCFDQVNLICATKHIDKSLGIIPRWWGVFEVTGSGSLTMLRKAQNNPQISSHGMADLLENNKAREILKQFGSSKGVSRMSHSQLQKAIGEQLSVSQLRELTKRALIERQSTRWRPSEQVA